MDAYYEAFVGRVAEGRHITAEQARELATGEVWLGTKAVELGLADEVGDLDRAIELAAERAGVPAKGVAVRARRGLIPRLMDRFATRAVGALTDAVEAELWRRDPRF